MQATHQCIPCPGQSHLLPFARLLNLGQENWWQEKSLNLPAMTPPTSLFGLDAIMRTPVASPNLQVSGIPARCGVMKTGLMVLLASLVLAAPASRGATPPEPQMPRVQISKDGKHFILAGSEQKFVPWGFNYLGAFEKLAEDDWDTAEGWQRIETDFCEMRTLGANVVRWHLQLETFVKAPDQVDAAQLARLKELLKVAHKHNLYLDLTGLNCFRLQRIPAWYDALPENERWAVQARFWEAIAKTCAGDAAVFCYDLMNEPIINEPRKDEHPWVGGELGGFHFVQRISNKLNGRDTKDIAAGWVKAQVEAIHRHDSETLITVGVIPWAFVWATAKPIFYSPQAAQHLDFVSIHVYPKPNQLEKELAALAVYDIGKPLVIEETFPLACSIPDLDKFMDAASGRVDGWISHYFGHTAAEHQSGAQPGGPMVAEFLEFWTKKGNQIAKTTGTR